MTVAASVCKAEQRAGGAGGRLDFGDVQAHCTDLAARAAPERIDDPLRLRAHHMPLASPGETAARR